MPQLIVSVEGVEIRHVPLRKDRTTLGRLPDNDIVFDNMVVSGHHCAFDLKGVADVFVEDLGSTNGTYINGKAIKRQTLRHDDIIEVGKYRIRFVGEVPAGQFDKTMMMRPGDIPPSVRTVPPPASPPAGNSEQRALIKVLSGSAAGRELPLQKVVTTFGKPGLAVAAITRRPQGYVVSHVDGSERALLNGTPVEAEPVPLHSGDTLELAGTRMQFVLV